MTVIAFIRHARTAWNDAKRVQGWTDIPLSDLGRAEIGKRIIPDDLQTARWYMSPLSRARETASLLGIETPTIDERLKETSWGDWEGLTFAQMVERDPEAMARRKENGATFRAPGGESLADVQARVGAWMKEQAVLGGQAGAIAHRGLIRCVLALATGWDFKGDEPYPMDWTAAHYFNIAPDGTITVDRLNIPLPLRDGA